ncbi:unnamed protein product [Mycena citricolor]|uniref:F-box domain-containing protein n=1 Tax=Mycena citricolor TaxID=2018698 RepID=A0AAD2HM74_9AGAR|nr:unnamed protein product [Mycena citricolor]
MALSLQNLHMPLELLRLIFEWVAEEDFATALVLVRVSRAVQRWVEPSLYSTVQLSRPQTSGAFIRTIEGSRTKPPMFFAAYVKSLCILFDMPSEHMLRITSVCTGIDNLTTWFLPSQSQISAPPLSVARALAAIQPRRISVWHGITHPHPTDRYPFEGPVFSRVTHLNITNIWEDWSLWHWEALPPTLTHISLDLSFRAGQPQSGRIAASVRRLLRDCRKLRVCALREVPRGLMSTALLLTERPEATIRGALVSALEVLGWMDPRIVFFCIPDPFQLRKAHCEWEDLKWRVLEQATKQRLVGDTSALAGSSRSHCL